ncbi:MAG: FAD-dependent oxidoreductase, partial [Burkholderiales bacterium]
MLAEVIQRASKQVVAALGAALTPAPVWWSRSFSMPHKVRAASPFQFMSVLILPAAAGERIHMKSRVLVLGAGFGGKEISTLQSEALGEKADVTLIDKGDAFVFGFSKLDVMFGRTMPEEMRVPYRHFVKPGVRFRHETIKAIDPAARRVVTDKGTYEAEFVVVALGADFDLAATPGLAEGGNEFYSVAGATRLREVLPAFSKGHAIVGVAAAPFKCPPAPSECALL